MQEKKEGRKVGEGAAVKFIKTEIIEPWEMFAETETAGGLKGGSTKAEVAQAAKAYHDFLVKHSNDSERMRCIVCGRGFRPRDKKGDGRQQDLTKSEK